MQKSTAQVHGTAFGEHCEWRFTVPAPKVASFGTETGQDSLLRALPGCRHPCEAETAPLEVPPMCGWSWAPWLWALGSNSDVGPAHQLRGFDCIAPSN